MKIVDQKIEQSGDDLGSLWYDFYGMTMAQSFDWIKRKGFDQYEVVDVKTWRKFRWFGKITRIHIVLEKLAGPSRSKSEFYDLLKWARDHSDHRISFVGENAQNVKLMVRDNASSKTFEVSINPEEYRKLYRENGDATMFMNKIWEQIYPTKTIVGV